MLYAMGHHATFNKYRQRNMQQNLGRPDSRASQLSSTNWASEDFDESEWEERYYQSSPEPYMQVKKGGVLNSQVDLSSSFHMMMMCGKLCAFFLHFALQYMCFILFRFH
jgi:hypothetical protein